VLASFGGPPPIGPLQSIFADPIHGCSQPHHHHEEYASKLVFVTRGECSFLEKASLMQRLNVSVLAIINSEDRLETAAAGLGRTANVTESLLLSMSNISVITLSNTTLEPLQFSAKQSQSISSISTSTALYNHASLTTHVVPLKCGSKSYCGPVLEEEKTLQAEVSGGLLRLQAGREVRSCDFLSSKFGGRLSRAPLLLVRAAPGDACTPLSPLDTSLDAATDEGSDLSQGRRGDHESHYVVLVDRGNCSFDLKAFHAQQAGASLVIVRNMHDEALQRLGGKQPLSGSIGPPSVLVSSACGQHLLAATESAVTGTASSTSASSTGSTATSTSSKGKGPIVTLSPSDDSLIADNWIDLAYTDWAADEDDLLTQIEGLVQKYTHGHPSNDIVAWLRRKADTITRTRIRTVATDEL